MGECCVTMAVIGARGVELSALGYAYLLRLSCNPYLVWLGLGSG